MEQAREQPPIEAALLRDNLAARGYSAAHISAALQKLETAADASERFMEILGKHYPTWREARAELNELPLTAEVWKE